MHITVCDQANEAYQVFFGARVHLHWSIPDPSKAEASEEHQLGVCRQVRERNPRALEHELLVNAVP
jgi:hypothetical protein